jgi:hypothetical protein
MNPITATELRRILDKLKNVSDEDRDDLLTDFLVRPYPTRRTQDN